MTIIVTTKSDVTVVERLSVGPSGNQRITDQGANTTQLKLNAQSDPPVSAKSHFAQPLSEGAATIDLLNLVGSQNQTLETANLRIQALKVQNPNPNPLVVTPATADGYALTFVVPAQGEILITSQNLMPAVASGAHLVSLTGTDAQTSNWMVVLG
jgi:hypothetical protein